MGSRSTGCYVASPRPLSSATPCSRHESRLASGEDVQRFLHVSLAGFGRFQSREIAENFFLPAGWQGVPAFPGRGVSVQLAAEPARHRTDGAALVLTVELD